MMKTIDIGTFDEDFSIEDLTSNLEHGEYSQRIVS